MEYDFDEALNAPRNQDPAIQERLRRAKERYERKEEENASTASTAG